MAKHRVRLHQRLSVATGIGLLTLHLAANAASQSIPHHARSSAQMQEAATIFLASLSASQRETTVHTLGTDARATWSNLPTLMAEPIGLLLADMTDEQRLATHNLLRASLSSQGYAKAAGIMLLDDVLRREAKQQLDSDPASRKDRFGVAMADNRSSANYAVALFGNPESENWGWKMTGHHLAVNFTVANGRVGFTPMFLGSSPSTVTKGSMLGWMALSHEGARGIEFMQSLSAAQQKVAKIHDEAARDVFEGPGRRASLAAYEGLQTQSLNAGQKLLLRALVTEYVRNADFDSADAQLDLIDQAGWKNLWFSWRGPVALNGLFYYRVHGPRILIEYNRQNPNHDHSVVRDPQNDYGEDWLEHHYEEFHPSIEDAINAARLRAGAPQS